MELEWIVAAALIGWLLTGLSWSVSNRQANARESRKEYRAALNSLESDIDRLLSSYKTYLTEPRATENEQARLQVHADLNRLRRHVELLTQDVGNELMDKYVELFEAVTSGQFESKTRKPENAAKDYSHAVTSAENLVSCAEKWFRGRYLPGK
jgi:hypothetical protein